MKRILIIALLLAPFVYAYYHKPQLDRHHEEIYTTAMGGNATFDEAAAALPQWEDLNFVDWTFFTATRDKKLFSLVSFGLLDHVFVVDSEWAPKAFKLTKQATN